MTMGFLAGKRLLITGLLSNRSIAYGIARSCHAQGAELAFTFQNDRFRDRVSEMAAEFGSSIVLPCDVAEDAQIDALFADLRTHWDGFDGLVHAIAFAPREAIAGDFLEGSSREAFRVAHDISAYSFVALAKAARPMLEGRRAALLTLSYLGALRVVPNYNTMGLAKASLEACGHPCEWHLGRPDQDPGRERHQGVWQDPGFRRIECTPASQRHH
jgi:enoyl-[acyl-carrier protein] reductase I